jgi:flagellar motor switch protein FliG
MFSHLRVWDTAHNNGVLVYLLLADRDVEIVADRGIQALLKGVERQTLLLALRGAGGPMRELFLKNMSQRAAADIVDEIEIMGPTAKAGVQNAQEEIVQIALKLQDEGLITIATGNAEMV